MLSDCWYNGIWCQRKPESDNAGLTELGQAALNAMHEHKLLVDASHMRSDAFDETSARLDQLDHGRTFR